MAYSGQKNTRVFFTTDIHGSTVAFKKFINAGKFYEAQIIVMGGDMVGKMIVPVVEQANRHFHANYLGKLYDLEEGEELDKVMTTFENSGLYPLRVTPEEVEAFKEDKKLVEERFGELAAERVRQWMEIAEERLSGTGIRCYMQPGNDDPYAIDPALNESTIVENVHDKVVELDEYHEMASLGLANQTPWNCPRDQTEEELGRCLDDLMGRVKDPQQSIMNVHVPPYGTNLDQAAELDEDLTPKLSMTGGLKMVPVGSTAVHEAIEKYQPLLSLHGHIHESRSAQKIGRTLCINPGSEYGEGVLRGLLFELSKDGLENYMFTQG